MEALAIAWLAFGVEAQDRCWPFASLHTRNYRRRLVARAGNPGDRCIDYIDKAVNSVQRHASVSVQFAAAGGCGGAQCRPDDAA